MGECDCNEYTEWDNMKNLKMLSAVMGLALCFFALAPLSDALGSQSGSVVEKAGGLYGRVFQFLMQLNLSDSQKRDIALMLQQYRGEVRTAVDGVAKARKDLLNAIDNDSYDENAVKQACRKVASCEEQFALLGARVISEIKGVLTPEQLSALKEKKADLAWKMKERVDSELFLFDQWIEVYSQ